MKRFKYLALATLVAFAACDEGEDITQVDPVVGTVTVNVTAEGEGVEGVQVTLAGPTSQSATTPASGTVTFQNVEEGSYAVTLGNIPGDVAFGTTAQTVTITEGNQNPTLSFSGSFVRTASLTVNVSAGGEPVPGVPVTIDGPEGSETQTTGQAGSYSFTGLLAGEYTVSIENPDEDQYTFNTTEQTVQLAAGGQREVNFVGEATGAEASVVIESITNVNTGLPADRNNIMGMVNITVGVDEGGQDVEAVEVYVGDQRVCRQSFAASVEEGPMAQESIDCVVNTAAFNTITGDNPFTSEVEEDVPFAPVFLNGALEIEARAITAGGETVSATEEVTFSNADALALTVDADDSMVHPQTGLRWLHGDLDITVWPIIYSAAFDPNDPHIERASLAFNSFVGQPVTSGDVGTVEAVATQFSQMSTTPGDDGQFTFTFSEDDAAPDGIANLITGSIGVQQFNVSTVTRFGQVGPNAVCANQADTCTGNLVVFFQDELQSGTGVVNNLLRVDNQSPWASTIELDPHPVAAFDRGDLDTDGFIEGWVNHEYAFDSGMWASGAATDAPNDYPTGVVWLDDDLEGTDLMGIGVDPASLTYAALLDKDAPAGDVFADGDVGVATGSELPGESGIGLDALEPPNTDEWNDISVAARVADFFDNQDLTNVLNVGVDGKAPIMRQLGGADTLEITVPADASVYNPVDYEAGELSGEAVDTNNGFSGVAGVVAWKWQEEDGEVANLPADSTQALVNDVVSPTAVFQFQLTDDAAIPASADPQWLPSVDSDPQSYWDVAAVAWDRAGNATDMRPEGPNEAEGESNDFIVDTIAPTVFNISQFTGQYVGGEMFDFGATLTDNVDLDWYQFGFDFDAVTLVLGTDTIAGLTLPLTSGDLTAFGPNQIITEQAVTANAMFVRCLGRFDFTGTDFTVAEGDRPDMVRFNVWDHAFDGGLSSTEANNIVAASQPTADCDAAALADEPELTVDADGPNEVYFDSDSLVLRGQTGAFSPAFDAADLKFYELVPEATHGDGVAEIFTTPAYLKEITPTMQLVVTDTGSGATGRIYKWVFSGDDRPDTFGIVLANGQMVIWDDSVTP